MTSNTDSGTGTADLSEPGPRSLSIRQVLERADTSIRKEFFDGLCGYLLASAERLPALARILLVYAVKRGELEPKPSQNSLKLRKDGASWKKVHEEMKALRDGLMKSPLLDGAPNLKAPTSPDTLRNFILGVSDRANGGDDIYALLGIFLIDVLQRHPSLKGEGRLTKEDRELISIFADEWQWIAGNPQPGASPLSQLNGQSSNTRASRPTTEEEADAESMRRYIARFFHFPEEQRTLLREYFETISCGEKGQAHLVCYRTQLSRPTSLIKSFLAIVPPGSGEHRSGLARNHTFSHFYQIDPRTANKRRSVGVVLPMSHGLYFVGGQHTMVKGQPPTVSNFFTLKVIAVPWQPIEQRRRIIPALALSTNNSEQHIVSRLAIRPTMLMSDEQVRIGAVEASALQADLEKLRDQEALATDKPSAFQNVEEVEYQAAEILKAINNIAELDVAGFFRKGRRTPINGAIIIERINGAFQDGPDPFVNEKDEPLTWSDIRFGALNTKL